MRLGLLVLCTAACATSTGLRPATPKEIAAARPAVALLQDGSFDEAKRESDRMLVTQPENSRINLVLAIVRYKAAMHQLFIDVQTVVGGATRGGFNHRYMRSSLEETQKELTAVESELARSAADPQIDLELCLACWRVDWNHNGRVDSRDEKIFENEIDENGNEYPSDDPRRRPTFRFDVGDVYWARAMVAFQRAAIELVMAYHWEEIDQLLGRVFAGEAIVIHIGDRERVLAARKLVLAGLDHADRARQEISRETDDDREWLPNPKQKSHPMPLPVDEALFVTWQSVTSDLRRLVMGQDGLSVVEIAQLGGHHWQNPPGGFIDIGRMFSDPRDITFDFAALKSAKDRPEEALASTFGVAYVRSMSPTALLSRFARMKQEMERGTESFERKLRYLLWLN